jgi:hypothetical protein
MTTADLSELELAAALAEEIYRRDAKDIPIKVSELGVEQVNLPVSGFAKDTTADATYYYTARGFVGEIVENDNAVYVVFRGTDSSEDFSEGAIKAVKAALIQETPDTDRKSDIGDWVNNLLLGFGTSLIRTQLDDALDLTQAAIDFAGNKEVVVVGQSLGGGLAGLVAAIKNVRGFAIAPAPFQKQLESVAEVLGGVDGKELKLLELTANLINNLEVHTIRGEVLSDGVGMLTALTGASPFPVQRTRYDVGETGAITGGATSNTPISLHSPTLHNLVIRTDESDQSFAELLQDDKALRYALFEKGGIAGPVENDRADPQGPGFGGSGLVSSGPTPTILYRALWKTVGDQDGFYDRFYSRFGTWLENGAVADGKSATSEDVSLHSGVLKLGLQVVRDALNRETSGQAVSEKGLNVFGTGNADGPTAPYVRVNVTADTTGRCAGRGSHANPRPRP